MTTCLDYLTKTRDALLDTHGDNILFIGGIGSFFHQDILRNEHNPQSTKSADLHVIVADAAKFHERHTFPEAELARRGLTPGDVTAIDKLRQGYLELNHIIPVYIDHTREGYRITVEPREHLNEWLSPVSPLGYVLKGRFGNAFVQLFPETRPVVDWQPIELKDTELETIIEGNYDDAVTLAFATMHGTRSYDEIKRHILKLSYEAEGLRGRVESIVKRKPQTIFEVTKHALSEIYYQRIQDYAEATHLDVIDGRIRIPTTHETARQTLSEFRERSMQRYARFLFYQEKLFPEADQYLARKALRMLGLRDNNETIVNALQHTIIPRIKQHWTTRYLMRLPYELIPEELRQTK
ncbi:MAG: hypothetical protein ABIA93_01820 [Candidatus Woesearchaeota archaeon]